MTHHRPHTSLDLAVPAALAEHSKLIEISMRPQLVRRHTARTALQSAFLETGLIYQTYTQTAPQASR
eukprot:6183568-Pleurochrysis_carterae.AAC.1